MKLFTVTRIVGAHDAEYEQDRVMSGIYDSVEFAQADAKRWLDSQGKSESWREVKSRSGGANWLYNETECGVYGVLVKCHTLNVPSEPVS